MKRILIADDSSAARALVAAELSDAANLYIERASSGLEAIKLLSTTAIDLVLTDVHMPDINGLELVRFIKQDTRLRAIPVIVMSTEAGEADRLRGLSLGADDYLAKPFTAEELRRLIRKYLAIDSRLEG
jgi:Response regulators consisting of a CheY-like receiver domain and a winged-helix DNA-binding domain